MKRVVLLPARERLRLYVYKKHILLVKQKTSGGINGEEKFTSRMVLPRQGEFVF